MKRVFRFCAAALALLYFLTPVALVFAQTSNAAGGSYPPPACLLSLNPGAIQIGGSVTLTWQSQNATGGNITGVGPVGPSGSINLLPSSASQTTFVGTFTGLGGTATCQATVAVSSGSGASVSGSSGANTQGGGGGTVTTGSTDLTGVTAPVAPVTSSPLPPTQTQQPSANGGLVPCGTNDIINSSGLGKTPQQNDSTGCQACDLAQLIQLIINFCIGVSIPIAAGLFAWAGILYFTSAADPGNIEKAKKIFYNAFVGFLIAITAWLVINTILHTILNQSFANGSWFTIQCTAAGQNRVVDASVNQVLSSLSIVNSSGAPNSSSASGTNGNSAYSCPTGYTLDSGGTYCNTDGSDCSQEGISCIQTDSNGVVTAETDVSCTSGAEPNSQGQCTDINGNVVLPSSGSGTGAQCTNGNCSVSALQSAGFNSTSANVMSCIAQTECANGNCGCNGNACGTFQIMLTINQLSGPDCAQYNNGNPTINCPALCHGNNGTAATTPACQPCVNAALNTQCNAESANALYQQSGYGPWTTSSDNPNSAACVATYGSN